MIIIATNNGLDNLPRLLRSIEDTNKLNIPISIIDTGSTDVKFLDYLDNFDIKYTIYKINGGYDSGAYIYAYENIKSEYYIFLQDSIEITSSEFYEIALDSIQDSYFLALYVFTNPEGLGTCEEALFSYFSESDFNSTKWGVFGPMFACSRDIMGKLYDSNLYFIPKNKEEQMAMERGWGIMVRKLNIPLVFLDHYYVLLQNNSPYLKKYFQDRQ